MNRVYLTVIAVMAACMLYLGHGIQTLRDEKAVLTEQNKTLMEAQNRAVEREKSDRKVLVARQAKIASKQRELAEAQEALSEALQRNKSWSNTDVPPDVQNALSGPSGGSAGMRNAD